MKKFLIDVFKTIFGYNSQKPQPFSYKKCVVSHSVNAPDEKQKNTYTAENPLIPNKDYLNFENELLGATSFNKSDFLNPTNPEFIFTRLTGANYQSPLIVMSTVTWGSQEIDFSDSKTKEAQVLKYLSVIKGINKYDAKVLFDIKRLDCLICELKHQGHVFKTALGKGFDQHGQIRKCAIYSLDNKES